MHRDPLLLAGPLLGHVREPDRGGERVHRYHDARYVQLVLFNVVQIDAVFMQFLWFGSLHSAEQHKELLLAGFTTKYPVCTCAVRS